jgi:FkbM family methyltransferase
MSENESIQGKALQDNSADRIAEALALIGRDPVLRETFVLACLQAEKGLAYPGPVRDDVTAPIVDALFRDVASVSKTLSTGEAFEFPYRSKIAREFVMSEPRQPDHVWEPQTTKLLLALANNARHVMVGGAYFGDHAILIAKKIAAWGGTCHAFEPNTEQLAVLVNNARLNGLENIKAHPLGLWNESNCHLKLVGDDSHAHPEMIAQADGDSFPTVTVDGYLAQQGVPALDLLMLDIEGGEFNVLKGARNQLALPEPEAPAIVFEVHRYYVDWTNGLDQTDVARFLASFGYTLFAVRDFNANFNMAGKPIELIPIDKVYLEGPPHGFNVLAVKGLQRLQSIAGYRITPGVSPKLLVHKDPTLHHPVDGLF